MEIGKVEVTADNKPVVTFKVTDAQGNLLKNANLDANSFRFTIAKVVTDKDSGLTSYESYITRTVTGGTYTWYTQTLKSALPSVVQATTDSGGKGVETDAGFTYVFSNTIPANYDKNATTVVGAQTSRDNRAAVANATFAFVPAGGTPNVREVVKTDACNQCHDPLEAHGARVEVGYCVTCHSPQTTDVQSGNIVDFKVMGPDGKTPLVVRDVGYNPVFYFGVTDAKAVARRAVVERADCNKCHHDIGNPAGLAIHGGSRMNTDFCVMCHNPNNTDEAQRPADKGTPVSIEFDYLIHSIHKGEERTTPFIVYGNGNSLHDFSEVAYPGNLANCTSATFRARTFCHSKKPCR